MPELAAILFGALLVNNFVLAQFLGLCPFMGATNNSGTALAMSYATTFVLTFSAVIAYGFFHWLLVPLNLEYLNIIVFIVVIAATVQGTELFLRHSSPVLHQTLGIYLPLITSNCAVLGVAILAVQKDLSLFETAIFAIGASLGFSLVMVLFAAMREKLQGAEIPAAFAGTPINLITAGITAMAFMGFTGMMSP